MTFEINIGDAFRIVSEKEDWLHDGEVINVTDEFVDVDFADWIQRYPRSAICEGYDFYERYLGPGLEPGETIRSYTQMSVAA
jgi:hypothetical protein